MVRLNKYLSDAGVCSRREADRLIEAGRVSVNGIRAVTGMKVEPFQEVRVGKKIIGGRRERIVLAVNKPVGIICTEERRERKSIIRYLNYPERITYAGRLDKDSEGLLIMTNDGDLIDAMMRGKNGHEKEYMVKSDRKWEESALECMRAGVFLEELGQKTRPCEIERIGEKTLRIVLTQGLNRQIRRMCETQGYRVKSLKRTRVINIGLEQLKPGEYRELTGKEREELYRLCGLCDGK